MGIYASKSYQNKNSQMKAILIADQMESLSANVVHHAVQDLSNITPNLHKLLSPVVDVAFKIQVDHGDLNLKQVKTSSSSLWQSNVCVNASTNKWHTDNDCSYRLVSVPKQDCVKKYVFFFRSNSKKYIGIEMKSGVSFISSMKLLTHSQHHIADMNRPSNQPNIDLLWTQAQLQAHNQGFRNLVCNIETERGNNFMNVCSYANHRLFTHIRASMQRNINENNE